MLGTAMGYVRFGVRGFRVEKGLIQSFFRGCMGCWDAVNCMSTSKRSCLHVHESLRSILKITASLRACCLC